MRTISYIIYQNHLEMGNNSNKELLASKEHPPPYDKIYEKQQLEKQQLEQEKQEYNIKMTKILFLNEFNEEIYEIFVKRNINICPQTINTNIIKTIIETKNIEVFKKIFDIIDDKYKFVNTYVINKKYLFEHILNVKKYEFFEYIFNYIDFNLIITDNYINDNWFNNQTVAHMICWEGDYESIMLLVKQKKHMMVDKDSYGLTPFDVFLLGQYLKQVYFAPTQIDNFINSISSDIFTILFNNKTTKKLEKKKFPFVIPINSSFVDIVNIICDKSRKIDESSKNFFTYFNLKICKKILE